MTDTLYLDIEAVEDRLLLVGWATNDHDIVVMDDVSGLWPRFELLLKHPNVTKVCQGDFDLRWFRLHGYEVAGPFVNTQVMAWVMDEAQPLDLESLLKRYAPTHQKQKMIRSMAGRLMFAHHFPLDLYDSWPDSVKQNFARYNRNDVETLRALYHNLLRALEQSENLEYWQEEQVRYSSVLLDMECRGLPVNLADTKALADEVRGERDRAAAHLLASAGLPPSFNLNSPKQLREYLFSKFLVLPDMLPMNTDPLPSDQDFEVTKVGRDYIHGVWTLRGRGLAPTDPPKRKPGEAESTEPSTASPELLFKHGDDEWVRTLCLDYRRSAKLLGTYLDRFPEVAQNGRIYGRYNQTGTATGRLSSSDPNMQNLPARREVGKRVRALFQGQFVIGDYDALEMRLMASFSKDPRLTKVFIDGGDPHLLTAHALFGGEYDHESPERDIAKTANYAIGYGAGAKKLAQTLTLAGFPTTFGMAKEYLALIEGFYPALYRWRNRVIWQAKDRGYVETVGGHRRRLAGAFESGEWSHKSYGERQAVNSIVQGSAADILRRVMIAVDERFPDLPLLAQIHDELLFEYEKRPTKETLASLQVICEQGHGYALRVPLSFVPVICASWADKGEGVDLSMLEDDA